MADRFWIALVDVFPGTPDDPEWVESFGDAAGGGFVHVLGMAKDAAAFRRAVAEALSGHGWEARGFEEVELLAAVKAREPLSPALEALESQLLRTGRLQFSRFFLYPRDESSTAAWLDQEAQDGRLSLTQSTVLANLARMLSSVELPELDESVGLTGQGSEELEVHLPHRSEAGLDLSILVRSDAEITVDYEYGHLHFSPELGNDWIGQALEFVYGALQGGVKVEIWATGDKLEQSRALLLLENGDWFPFPAWAATPDPDPAAEPVAVTKLSFLEPGAS
ncbi:MAG TPA: hypothetical protein VHJ78_03490 [Actinomycetota bacterium]|nr:hypothetical protein [Actinomycetota bacterium]